MKINFVLKLIHIFSFSILKMGQENSRMDYKIHSSLTKEQMKEHLYRENFVFNSKYYYATRYPYPHTNLFLELHCDCERWADYRKFDNFDSLLDSLISCNKYRELEIQKFEIRDEIMPRMKNLVNLGFAEDIDYSRLSYKEIKEALRAAKEKQQQHIKYVQLIGKQLQEKEENRALQEAETIMEEGQKS
jgi:hypothetical protein